MAIDVLFHDTRLEGHTPRPHGWSVYDVNRETPLEYFIGKCLSESQWHNGIDTLSILAHGNEEGGQLGFGIMFCHEQLLLGTLPYLIPLQDKIQKVIFPVTCGTARSSLPNMSIEGVWPGDGHTFCSRMASTLHAEVTASTERQVYHGVHSGVIDAGEWEGLVVTYGRDGLLIPDRTERHRSAWRARRGRWRGNN